jgi:Second Messenger Oligonucleotide or Dinucleotide Synthetase domain/Adenylyl/Guanylyl and SMODS C-terminal sensor domain
MKHVELFKTFLRDTVNLNDTRIKDLETSIEAIKDAVRGSDWEPHINGWMAHGSWAHKTIIRPVDAGEFDADLIVFVEHVHGWTAATYIGELYNAFRASATYKGKVSRYSHCVTISYANDKKIDVAPCLTNRLGQKQLEVCNRTKDRFERTEPEQYTRWLVEKNGYSGGNSFRKVTRLIKYLRDIKERFTCSSVLLTTLLGNCMTLVDKDSPGLADTPTALRTVLGRLDDLLQLNPTKPWVTNPFLLSENFADTWTTEQYSNFRDKIHIYREWVDDAYAEEDRSESIAKWRRVFGEDFARGSSVEEGRSVSKAAVANIRRTLVEASDFTGDLVDAVKRYGARVLPADFDKKPYMEAPRWKRASGNISVVVRADLHPSSSGSQLIRTIREFDALPPGYWLHFRATMNTGSPFDASIYCIMWRVTNTDEHAAGENALRGNFVKPESDNSRWELLKFRGVHIVEAFVLRKRDDRIVGKSPAYHVMIE